MKQYSSYKDSGVEWIGEIPSKWSIEKPKYILKKVTREIKNTDEIITCFRDGTVTLRKNRREEGFTISLKEIGYQRIHEGDLVIHEMDGFEGSIGVSDSVGKSSPVYTVISPSEEYEVQYWMYLLREMAQTHFIASLAKSIRERTSEFRWNVWRSLYFPIPPLQEQKKIADYLDKETAKIDLLLEKTEKKIELLKEQRDSIINQAVTKGLDPNVEMKDSGVEWIGSIPIIWNINKIKRNTYVKGRIGWKGLKNDEFIESGPYLITGTDFTKNGIINWDNMYHVSTERYEEDSFIQLKQHDVLITKDGSMGKIAYVDKLKGPTCLNSGIFVTRPTNSEYITRFFFWVLNSFVFTKFINYTSHGSTILHLYQNVFEDFIFPIPPLQEQKQIAGYLDKETARIDSIVELESKRMELLEEYRQSLISNAVTGKIDVRGMN